VQNARNFQTKRRSDVWIALDQYLRRLLSGLLGGGTRPAPVPVPIRQADYVVSRRDMRR
jgi:hypothetical protein